MLPAKEEEGFEFCNAVTRIWQFDWIVRLWIPRLRHSWRLLVIARHFIISKSWIVFLHILVARITSHLLSPRIAHKPAAYWSRKIASLELSLKEPFFGSLQQLALFSSLGVVVLQWVKRACNKSLCSIALRGSMHSFSNNYLFFLPQRLQTMRKNVDGSLSLLCLCIQVANFTKLWHQLASYIQQKNISIISNNRT